MTTLEQDTLAACKNALYRLEWLGAEHDENGNTVQGSCLACEGLRKVVAALEAQLTKQQRRTLKG